MLKKSLIEAIIKKTQHYKHARAYVDTIINALESNPQFEESSGDIRFNGIEAVTLHTITINETNAPTLSGELVFKTGRIGNLSNRGRVMGLVNSRIAVPRIKNTFVRVPFGIQPAPTERLARKGPRTGGGGPGKKEK